MKKIYSKILKCRICNDKNLVNICKFENIKLTGIFPKDKKKYIDETPLEVVFPKNLNYFNSITIIIYQNYLVIIMAIDQD